MVTCFKNLRTPLWSCGKFFAHFRKKSVIFCKVFVWHLKVVFFLHFGRRTFTNSRRSDGVAGLISFLFFFLDRVAGVCEHNLAREKHFNTACWSLFDPLTQLCLCLSDVVMLLISGGGWMNDKKAHQKHLFWRDTSTPLAQEARDAFFTFLSA